MSRRNKIPRWNIHKPCTYQPKYFRLSTSLSSMGTWVYFSVHVEFEAKTASFVVKILQGTEKKP